MDVEFRNRRMKSRYDDHREAARAWGQQIGERYIRVVSLLMSVREFRELYDVPSIKLHQLKGNRRGEYSLRLNVQMRLIVEHDEARKTIIVKEVSKHYGD